MRLFGSKQPEVQGEIGYYGLGEWWLKTFTEAERRYIEEKYQPMTGSIGGPPNERPLTQGVILSSTQDVTGFLSGLATWFRTGESDREIGRRILQKAIELSNDKRVVSLHFAYQGLIESWYPDRDKLPHALDEAILACQAQIKLGPKVAKAMKKEFPDRPLPRHIGFQQLTIIYDKKGQHQDAIKVSEEAKKQGWNGDWDNRIERYRKKLAKQK